MSTATSTNPIPELRRAVRQARGDAYLVEPRVIRRVIRELYNFARLSTRIPHTDVLIVRRADIQQLTHPDELGLSDFSQLPDLGVLVAQPEDHELEHRSIQDLMQFIWGRLFHGCIDLNLQLQISKGTLSRASVQDSIDRIGQVEFDEAHAVLKSELRLINHDSHVEAYCEFVAIYLQLSRFSPDLLTLWFPSLAGSSHVLQVISQHIDPQKIYRQTQLYGATEPDLTSGAMQDEIHVASERRNWTEGLQFQPSSRRHDRLIRRRLRWNERGNTVASAVLAMQAAEASTTEQERTTALELAKADTHTLAERLRSALNFQESALDNWRQSLWELLQNSTHGFWNAEKKLLYDLQKVCLDHERTVYQVDLVKWIVSRGKRPLRRPLANLREVMMAKHLASSAARLVYVRLSGTERERLSGLLHAAARLAEDQMRERMRSAVRETIADVGLKPRSIPEQVAFDKMIEESLDCITERGYLTMGYLRDAISRNDLKLPDLTDPKDLVRGDHLLRTDDRLDVSLDGVYRRGEFYLRWLQVISSLAFGTRVGRFATLFMAIPFGGAVVIVVGVHHLLGVLTGSTHHHDTTGTDSDIPDESSDIEPPAATDINAVAESDETTTSPDDAADSTPESSIDVATASTEDNAEEAVAVANDAAPPAAETSSDVTVASDESAEPTATVESVVHEPSPLYTWVGDQTVPLSVAVGFLLMALIHLPRFRNVFWNAVRSGWKVIRTIAFDVPLRIIRLPMIQRMWRSRWFVRVRRTVINPLLLSWFGCRVVPTLLLTGQREAEVVQPWWMVMTIGLLMSLAVNSRLGRDAEELASEWLANAWHDLRSRFLVAVFEWTIDFFKWLLNLLERFIYAVDEWLRFHSGETWATLVAKAVLGVIWSFVSFLIRIYVNLLIEPTLHPVKHFPVVTVAHKLLFPVLPIIIQYMNAALEPSLGTALAGTVTGFNIFFLPGIFGFLVWELKENWRLYASNRVRTLQPVVIGSHGETGGRLLKTGFHSGTLPKLFGRLRRLERKDPSFHRFSERRACRESLEHVERDIRRFVERDLVRLLTYCKVWEDSPIRCHHIHSASNSFLVALECTALPGPLVEILFQEQSGWLVATVATTGWLERATPEQLHSFETALRGFYKKAGVDLVREQMERTLIGPHPYDVCADGLAIWPERQFDRQITCDLDRRHQIRPWPPALAASYGLQPVSREALVFASSEERWIDWQQVWETPTSSESSAPLPLACLQSARSSLLKTSR